MSQTAHFKLVAMFLLAWIAASIFWHFLIRGAAAHHAENPIVQGLMALE